MELGAHTQFKGMVTGITTGWPWRPSGRTFTHRSSGRRTSWPK